MSTKIDDKARSWRHHFSFYAHWRGHGYSPVASVSWRSWPRRGLRLITWDEWVAASCLPVAHQVEGGARELHWDARA